MEIKNATEKDFNNLQLIYKNAREFMVQNNNFLQWQDMVQLQKNVMSDIKNGNCYICLEKDVILGVFCFFVGKEPTYNKIYNGKWLNDKSYGVIHRIAVAVHNKGVASFCIKWCFNKFSNVKIDTHKDNIAMQKVILKNGFTYCGIIKKEDGSQRLAYQKIN